MKLTLELHKTYTQCLFTDNPFTVQDTENSLQQLVYKLQQLCNEYNMKISITKIKVVAFRGPERTKICIYNKTIEQVYS